MILNTDYVRQIFTGLSTDDWGDVEFFEGDVVYIMDQSQCWICDGTTMHQLPDLGGGGGHIFRTQTLTIEVTRIDSSGATGPTYMESSDTDPLVFRTVSLPVTANNPYKTETRDVLIIDGMFYCSISNDLNKLTDIKIDGVVVPAADIISFSQQWTSAITWIYYLFPVPETATTISMSTTLA